MLTILAAFIFGGAVGYAVCWLRGRTNVTSRPPASVVAPPEASGGTICGLMDERGEIVSWRRLETVPDVITRQHGRRPVRTFKRNGTDPQGRPLFQVVASDGR